MSHVDNWRADTVRILSEDEGGKVVTVTAPAYDFGSQPAAETASSTIETSTVQIFPLERIGRLEKDPKGLVAEATHYILFPFTSSIAVAHRIREADASDYYEALSVGGYEDHKEVLAKLVENR